MTDIRSFWGVKPPASSGASPKDAKSSQKKTTPQKPSKKRKSKVIGINSRVKTRADNRIESDEEEDDKY